MKPDIRGHVARLLTDDELLLNIGAEQGVEVDMVFKVLDPRAQNVKDPISGADLGSVERVKAKLRVIDVGEHLALCRVHPPRDSGISGAARVLSGAPRSGTLTGTEWPDGVSVRDPVYQSGRIVKRPPPRRVTAEPE